MFTNTNVGQCHSQLILVHHLCCKSNSLILRGHTPTCTSRGAGLLTPLAKWVSPLTLVANEGWRGGYRHLYCMIHDPEASAFLALCRSLLSTTTASYMRSDITCATLREYFSWATATADFEFSTRLSVLIQQFRLPAGSSAQL